MVGKGVGQGEGTWGAQGSGRAMGEWGKGSLAFTRPYATPHTPLYVIVVRNPFNEVTLELQSVIDAAEEALLMTGAAASVAAAAAATAGRMQRGARWRQQMGAWMKQRHRCWRLGVRRRTAGRRWSQG